MARRPPARAGVPRAKLAMAAPEEAAAVLEPVAEAPLVADPVAPDVRVAELEADAVDELEEDSSMVVLPHWESRLCVHWNC